MRFDPWGRRTDAASGSDLTDMAATTFDHCATTRGFTGHEMLDEVGVVHMNGRIYDPSLARFLQADPYVQFPSNLQNHNRYSYVMNNPLSYTDPSGNFIFSLTATAILAASGTTQVAVVSAVIGAAAFADALVRGASFFDALLSGISASAMTFVGGSMLPGTIGLNAETLVYVATVSTVGGITSSLQGGQFGHGFKMAGLSSVLGGAVGSSRIARQLGGAGQLVAKLAIAGTLSEMSGGKFANGAMTAAFAAVVSDSFERGLYTSGSDETDRKLSHGIYDPDFKGADGYNLVSNKVAKELGLTEARFSNEKVGLVGGLFANEHGDHVLVFAGTDKSSWVNWKANLRQALGFKAGQYTQAIKFAQKVVNRLGQGTIRFTGHSLGGGLASAAAIVTGRPATTFNAAGLHSNTVGGRNALASGAGLIRAYHSSFDVLSIVQKITPLPDAAGQRIPMGRAGLHGMGGLCRAAGGC